MHTCLHSLSLTEGLVLLTAPGDQTLSLEIQTIKMKEIVIFFTNSGVKMYESNIIMRPFIYISSKMCNWVSRVKAPLAIDDEYPAARTAVMGRAAPSCTTHKT